MFSIIVGGIAVLYVSSKVFENFMDIFVFIPGFILIGLFIGLLNGGDFGETSMWMLGVPLVFFALKPS
jgi:hypothetical protein